MTSNKLDKIIKAILSKGEKPIVAVHFLRYDLERRRKREGRHGGVLIFWDETEGRLMLAAVSKGSNDEKGSVRMPVIFYSNEVLSVKILEIQDLIDNTNALYSIIMGIDEKKKKIL